MSAQTYRQIRYRVTAALIFELISLLCMLFWTGRSLSMATTSQPRIYALGAYSEQELEQGYPRGTSEILAAASGLLYLLARFLVTLILKLPLWQQSSTEDLKPQLALVFLGLASLALLVVTALMRT